MRVGLLLLVGLLSFSQWQPTAAQAPDNAPNASNIAGVSPFASISGDKENVDLASGAVNLNIPILSVPQLGGRSLNLSLIYDSNVYVLKKQSESYSPHTNGTWSGGVQGQNVTANFSWQANPNTGLHWNLPYLHADYAIAGITQYPEDVNGNVVDVSVSVPCVTNWSFSGWDGVQHHFIISRDCLFLQGQFMKQYDIDVDYAVDGSGIRMDATNPSDLVVTTSDGTAYHFSGYTPAGGSSQYTDSLNYPFEYTYYDSAPSKIVDVDGNTITISAPQSDGSLIITDTVGRTFTFNTAGLTYTDANGVSRTVTVSSGGAQRANGSYTGSQFINSAGQYTFQHPGANGSCNATYDNGSVYPTQINIVNENTQTGATTTTISIPTGGAPLTYVLGMNPLDELTYIQYPNGGYTTYDWDDTSDIVTGTAYEGQVFGDLSCPMEHHEVIAKHACSLSTGTCSSAQLANTTYQQGFNNTYGVNGGSSVIDPAGNATDHILSFFPVDAAGSAVLPVETQELIYSGSNQLLRTINTSYTAGMSDTTRDVYRLQAAENRPFYLPTSVTTIINDQSSSLSTVKTTQYESFTIPDPAPGDPSFPSGMLTVLVANPVSETTTAYDASTVLKTSITTYMGANDGALYDPTQGNVLNRPHVTTVSDGSISSTTARTYDAYGRLATSTLTGTNITVPLATTYSWDANGDLTQSTDTGNHPTILNYGNVSIPGCPVPTCQRLASRQVSQMPYSKPPASHTSRILEMSHVCWILMVL